VVVRTSGFPTPARPRRRVRAASCRRPPPMAPGGPSRPLIGFPFARSIPWARLEPNPRPGTRKHVSPASRRRPRLAADTYHRRSSRLPRPHRRIKIRQPRPVSTLDPIPVNRGPFCSLAIKFSGNQPAVHHSSKVFLNRSFSFCLGPCLFLK
jgi:hypothetical protein